MTDDGLKSLLTERYAMAQTPWGRWRLDLRVRWKRLTWKFVLGGALLIKRVFDVVATLGLLILLNPLLLIIALLIKLEDHGPVLFIQRRVGKHGREFRMYKFRSMFVDAESRLRALLAENQHEQGVTFKMKNDPRVTRVGKWLRKLSFDELPQLFNVVKGDMSLVGPRPPIPREVELYRPEDRRRLEVVPGITCLWQIGGRSEIDFSGQVRLDVQYIESQSFWGDLKILLKTVPAVLTGHGAY
ncbi:MAG TPA: sugar transferase [Candidatus Paceibacterota bacterium]|nr:sugar transferase [Verrucomicrobiota bacterium]HRY49289.1 sugar transferase [Candidatus Paceibacterota bacterium]HSA01071.1 sugar transferase [Candidatus Paceibacterota bacterium]